MDKIQKEIEEKKAREEPVRRAEMARAEEARDNEAIRILEARAEEARREREEMAVKGNSIELILLDKFLFASKSKRCRLFQFQGC